MPSNLTAVKYIHFVVTMETTHWLLSWAGGRGTCDAPGESLTRPLPSSSSQLASSILCFTQSLASPSLFPSSSSSSSSSFSSSTQILEHTEFFEDGTLKPFSSTKPYHKRCIQKTITSGGQVQYVHPDQLAVPEEFSGVEKFPEKFVVDGFIICIDVSSDLDVPGNPQREFLEKLLPALLGVKKTHVVVAFTKFDIAKETCIAAANEILAKTKRQLTVIEASAEKGVNVDLCFLVLAHLVDSKLPRTKITTFAEADLNLKERIRKNEETFQQVLDERVVDFSIPIHQAPK